MNLEGKRALVTGAASGIGEAIARKLAGEGAFVVCVDLNEEAGLKVADEIGGKFQKLDLSDIASIPLKIEADILMNVAGLQHVSPVQDFDTSKFQMMIDIMLVAPFALSKAVLPGMYEKGWGRIVHISSVHGVSASPYKSAYISAKHGLEGLSKTIAREGASHGVTSNTIGASYVRTPLVENQIAAQAKTHGITEAEVLDQVLLADQDIKRLLEPSELAEMAYYLCTESATGITGAHFAMDGGRGAR